MPAFIDIIINMTTRGEDPKSLAEKINKIIPFLNGHDPEILKQEDFAPAKPAKSEFAGPKAMTKK
jgi:hypothetical protein